MAKTLPKGYTCKCGEKHKHHPWVYAHWDMELTHTCSKCKRKNILHKGKMTYGIRPTKK